MARRGEGGNQKKRPRPTKRGACGKGGDVSEGVGGGGGGWGGLGGGKKNTGGGKS